MSEERGPRDWSEIDGVTLRLVRAPLTFGHTQFRIVREEIECASNNAEEPKPESHGALFERAGKDIGRAIEAMHQCLTEELLEEFHDLATVTETKGKLIKVLVLRASASEDVDKELKIHLVPYFRSHHDACLKRFARRHRVLPGTPGGLLGWIGEQEDRADKWEVDYPREDKLNQWAKETLRLPELAERLRNMPNGDDGSA